MYQGNNKTALASQAQIADALIGLMGESSYAQISICQICRRAKVSRQTFYSLFSSKDKVILYELENKYGIDLEGPDCCQKLSGLSLRDIARIYSRYIREKGHFLKLLVDNEIIDCMTDSLNRSFLSCSAFLSEVPDSRRRYAALFLAGGLTSIARCYVSSQETADEDQLTEIIYALFSGSLFLR